ncbi:MAG: hypothetical protein A2268_15990 [Candidatus Raymondbacteria bacterium RifOxyA12_full_50_37]|nr:MAG: hypothetical protein A2268_15990 [Candidatus Raymondbacteria bacterium RifOxyA12_full_50_37]OGJ89249.1 MAG: hypothetical protein A2248_18885 [Candidatus Raymondbacteria bacterium RIFOXYA2_FULL_49_16]OGJ97415.1 MAG: hypothetical protein A2453_03805 [Candidatus Raymondbacteria bacterium RIFOXYC2_FULL_50_21]OGK00752.1 MAG: hypothetical protein A2487_08540 [Candidatus Raymondbacteria bacterium RifOxyC12_full_50_8]OGK03799.1 MAG: hypothetical protein A2350_11430 [Candidatus Raymondbacteria b
MVEFVVCAAVVAIIFGGIVFFGRFGIISFSTAIAARNSALQGQGTTTWAGYEDYVRSNAEIYRFTKDFERELDSHGHALVTLGAVSEQRFKNRVAVSFFMVDKNMRTQGPSKTPGPENLLRKNLFGETHGPSR